MILLCLDWVCLRNFECVYLKPMQFIYPEFLLALLALAIPIIIHLFNFRRFKKILFTNVRFLREIKQDTQSRSRLKHLLILLTRLSAITFLVLAFAQPFIPVRKTTFESSSKRVSIYIDNSFSMDALGNSGNLLEVSKKKAREIANTGISYNAEESIHGYIIPRVQLEVQKYIGNKVRQSEQIRFVRRIHCSHCWNIR